MARVSTPLTRVEVERIVRDLLLSDARPRALAVPSQAAIAGAVRAEFARRNIDRWQLTEVIGVSRPTAYGRFSGAYPFSAVQLEKVAASLGMGVGDLYALAGHGDTFMLGGEGVVATATLIPRSDAWEQPARARRRSG